jgi:hypothetical protein
VSGDGVTGAAEEVLAAYLGEVAARLGGGPAGIRRDILAELGAGLADAADAHRAAGLDPAGAARAAVAEFGRPARVASGFRAELAVARARRTALTLLATGPMVGILWLSAALASHVRTPPWRWAGLPADARLAAHLAVIALVTAIASAVFTVAATGRLTRWLPALCSRTSAVLAAGGTVAIDVTLLTLFAAQAASTPGRLAALPAAIAAAASCTRLALATRATRNCLPRSRS